MELLIVPKVHGARCSILSPATLEYSQCVGVTEVMTRHYVTLCPLDSGAAPEL